jgi:hypothetical protein
MWVPLGTTLDTISHPMQPTPETPDPNKLRSPNSLPPPIPAAQTPLEVLRPGDATPPRVPGETRRWLEPFLSIILSLCLGSFLADAILSLADDTSVLVAGVHLLLTVRIIVFLFGLLLWVLVYFLMGITPMIPKRIFVPVTMFALAAQLISLPLYIYGHAHAQQVDWGMSLLELLVALAITYRVVGGFRFRWPLVSETQLVGRRFSWLNLYLFLPLSVLVIVPAVFVYLWVCAALAVDHFTDSFMALRPGGFTVQVRKYTRPDGKTITLVPMSHIGEPDFYRDLSQSFPTNALILMEGVTDNQNLLTNRITYKRAAKSLGLAEQQREFKPAPDRIVRADVDIEEFSPTTIALLNVAMLFHSRGLTPETLPLLLQYSPPPRVEETLIDDLLRKRNRRLLREIQVQLRETDSLIVPWGVAHMPEISKEIEKSGFLLGDTREYVAIRFGRKHNPK